MVSNIMINKNEGFYGLKESTIIPNGNGPAVVEPVPTVKGQACSTMMSNAAEAELIGPVNTEFLT